VFIQNRAIRPFIAGQRQIRKLPLPFALLNRFPLLRRIPARLVGMGFRPEHIAPQSRH
jgi:hypothetical protein